MALENLIPISFSDHELQQLSFGINTINEVLTGKTVTLSPEQRKQYGRIANQNKQIVDCAKKHMEKRPKWIPNFLDKEEFDRDYHTRKQIDSEVEKLKQLTQQLIDTKMLLDYDNYSNALSFYRMVRYLAGENEPNAEEVYQEMKILFGKNKTVTDESEE